MGVEIQAALEAMLGGKSAPGAPNLGNFKPDPRDSADARGSAEEGMDEEA